MRDPQQVLNALCEHSKDSDYRYERLYRILFNEEMFFIAYQRKYANQGNMTPGTDGRTIDRMSIDRIRKIVASLRDESYKPHPARRVHIPKKNGKNRPLGIPSFEDKLVQEVVHMILEAIYEGHLECWPSLLKELGELAEINELVRETYYKGNERIDEVTPKYALLSTHAGRKTFICNALALGIPAPVVMKWTGHSDYKAMKPYIDIADDIRANAMNKFNQL